MRVITECPELKSLFIYLTHDCNQRCGHCWINARPNGLHSNVMPSCTDYFRLIDSALPLGLKSLKLTGGEPLLSDKLEQVLEYSTGQNLSIAIETNAMLVDSRWIELFRRFAVEVSVSLDGASPEVHDASRGVKGAFQLTWKAIEEMAGAHIPLVIICAVSRRNVAEIPKILERLRSVGERGQLCLKINPIIPVGRAENLGPRGQILSPEELLSLASYVTEELVPVYTQHQIGIALQLEMPFFDIRGLARGDGRIGASHCGFAQLLSVLADGSISFCGVGYAEPGYTMGNITEQYDLADIWHNHPVLKRARMILQNGLEGVCRECLFQPVCRGGCRALALECSKSLSAAPLWCQSLFDAGLFPKHLLRNWTEHGDARPEQEPARVLTSA
jgi:SynChlorMet cassette radical SAM/SPASM protein ScmF